MPTIPIESLDDPCLAPYRHLKATNLTRWSGLFVAEGAKLAQRLIASRYEVDSLLLGRAEVAEFAPLVSPETPLYVVPDDLVEQVVGFNFHRGVLACGRRPAHDLTLADILATLPAARRATIVVCPEIQDPDNLGSLIRTCCALGVDGLMLGPHSADPLARRVLRVSMGAVLELPLVVSTDMGADLHRLRQSGFDLVAAVLDETAEPLHAAARANRTALLIGSEGHGLDDRWIAACDRRVTIPMSRGTDSLNLSVAAGIFLHHFTGETAG